MVAIKLRTEPVYNPITNLVYVGTNRYPFLPSFIRPVHCQVVTFHASFSPCACAVVRACACACARSVTDVWVAGKQLVKDEKMIGMNEDVLLRKAQQWGEKIKTSRPPANPAHEVSA